MIVTKDKPAGIDKLIQTYQNFLYVQLQRIWTIQATDYASYGRVYRNQSADGYVPEAYMGTSEYKDTFFDDTFKVSSFWGMGEMQRFNGGLLSNVFSVFQVKLDEIKPSVTWRPDEEARIDVEDLCKTGRFGFILNSVETGIDNVFREFSGWKKKEGVKYRDMYPWHCFRLNFSINYPINKC